PLNHTIVMETGGMKGRRKEITRVEVHELLKSAWKLNTIHSEYGMSELLSQAYSKGNGIFSCPPWMRVLLRDEDDPLTIKNSSSVIREGLINVIDLANIYSCSFIATDDIGKLYTDNSFEVNGRMDSSDIRGCSLLYASA
ncbi:MAG: acyl transferase, partial [Chitinophagaceae bacterium]|nr:acyl transferase [Chitinophagaceae bacterium]